MAIWLWVSFAISQGLFSSIRNKDEWLLEDERFIRYISIRYRMRSQCWLCKTLKGGLWIAPNRIWMRPWLTPSVNQVSHTSASKAVQKEVLLLNSASGLFCISSSVFPDIYSPLVSLGPQPGHTCVASQSLAESSWDLCLGPVFLPKWAHPEPGNNPPSSLI